MLAAWLNNFDPFIFSIDGFGPRWYGLSYVAAALCAFWLYRRLAVRGYADVPPEKVADLITWVGLFGVLVGGRLGWIIFYGRFSQHAEGDHWWWARVWEGGMASHGGILGVVLSTFVISRLWKVSWTGIGDSLCVVATVGIFLVRCANFVNGELYGHETTAPWGVQFATEVRDDPSLVPRVLDPTGLKDSERTEILRQAVAPLAQVSSAKGERGEAQGDAAIQAARFQHLLDNPALLDDPGNYDLLRPLAEELIVQARSNPTLAARFKEVIPIRHPSQLYEGLLEGLLLFVILWTVRTRMRVPRGMLTGLFFILYATARIFGETYRIPDPAWKKGTLSAGQYLSLYMYAVGAVFVAWSLWRREYEQADRVKIGEQQPAIGKS